MTRIAMLTSVAYPPTEGIGFYSHGLARQLVSRGHSVTLVTRGGLGRTPPWDCDGVSVIELPFAPLYPLHVHVHGLFVRRFLAEHRDDFDVAHAHTPLVPVPKDLPLVVTVHTPMKADTEAIPVRDLRSLAIRAQGFVSQRLERSLFARADVLLAVASSVARELSAYGIDPSRVAVTGNAVDADEFSPGATNMPEPVVMYSGRLSDRKGLADLIHAMALLAPAHPPMRLRLVGSGPAEGDLRRLAVHLGLSDRVEFVGHVPSERRHELVRMYREAAVYVQPSHYEGLPTSLLEAMACGRPCVATEVSGHPDAIQDGLNGLLVPPRDPSSLARSIGRYVSDPPFAERIGRAGRGTILQRFTWESLARVHEQAYERARVVRARHAH